MAQAFSPATAVSMPATANGGPDMYSRNFTLDGASGAAKIVTGVAGNYIVVYACSIKQASTVKFLSHTSAKWGYCTGPTNGSGWGNGPMFYADLGEDLYIDSSIACDGHIDYQIASRLYYGSLGG